MNIALILSGGTGSRMGLDTPKQYIKVNNKLLITYCLDTLINHADIDYLQIVCDSNWQETILADLAEHSIPTVKIIGFSTPGKNRQLSILNGLYDIKDYLAANPIDPIILIHDAARPNLTAENVSDYLEAINDHDGLMPVLPMKDTVYLSEDGQSVSSLLDRSKIYAGQAPELYRLTKYLEANESLLPDKILAINGSTEPAIMAGLDVAIVPGNENNYKITTTTDLEKFKACIS